MKRLFVLIFFVSFSGAAWCQHSSNSYNKLGDSLYAQHHFLYAAKYYEKALKNAPNPGSIMIKLARSYGKLNEPGKSAQWYASAKTNRAVFSNDDIYQYAQALAMEEQRVAAEAVLRELIEKDPYARKERDFLEDLLNYKKYYQDSVGYKVRRLTINTSVSEFAPAFYKDGIVYSSATPQNGVKPKYHWDNSHFLNLVYSKIVDGKFQEPKFFENDLNTKYHDGPAVFYNHFNSMIVNRNQKSEVIDGHGRDVWHMALLDAQYNAQSNTWKVTPLPFDEPPYSFLHPSISEDGNTLYFVSDKPGGYGGTDIYRSARINGIWSEPFNLGPTINSSDNEVFPFFDGNILYFASRGHGGLGGHDIYKTAQTVNGFTPPENLGFPINSSKDDFSFILSKDQRTGYLSSSRNGNDDLYAFEKIVPEVPLLAHTFDGITHEALAGAGIQLISSSAQDLSLTADTVGNFGFNLPEGTDYMIVVTKGDMVGMRLGTASRATDEGITHQLPAYNDTTTIPCVGIIHDSDAMAAKAKQITVFDETTNKEILRVENSDMVNFAGEKNHRYRIEIQNANGDTTVQNIDIEPASTGVKTWTMTLAEDSQPLTMAARIFNAENDQPLSGARVEIITFADANLELAADADGRVDFTLPAGTTFLLIGSNANYSGMFSGVAEKGQDKASIIHPVPAFGDKDTLDTKFLMALVTDENGDIIKEATVAVRDKVSGDSLPVKVSDGLLYFRGKIGRSYTIAIDHDDFDPFGEEVTISEETNEVEKISLVLKQGLKPKDMQFALRVFRDSDKVSLSGATVTIISSSDADHELITDSNGLAHYTLADGVAYMAIARKDDQVGNFIGMADKEFTKEFTINPLPTFAETLSQSPVVAKLVDDRGNLIPTAHATVLKASSGEKISTQENGGLISFMGQSGEEYKISITDQDHGTITRSLTVDPDHNGIVQMDLVLKKETAPKGEFRMEVQVVRATDKSVLSEAKVVVISFSEPDKEFIANTEGRASFTMAQGNDFMIVGSKEGYVGMLAGTAEKGNENSGVIHIIEAFAEDEKAVPVVAEFIDDKGEAITIADVSVTELSSEKEVSSRFEKGILTFVAEKGKRYNVTVEHDGNTTTHIHTVTDSVGPVEKLSIVLPETISEERRPEPNTELTTVFNKNLIVFQTETGEPKVYFTDHGSFGEISEHDGDLYLQKGDSTVTLGKGKLSNISAEAAILRQLKLSESEIIGLKNIYFDFNKAQLDEQDKIELEKVNYVMANFPDLQLITSAHADDRGQDNYNMTLSKRRVKAVGTYLTKRGIAKERIIQKAMGETLPEVSCATRECTEEEHQRNRRAEFMIRVPNHAVTPNVDSSDKRNNFSTVNKPLAYQEILNKYGNNKIANLKLKIALGVYRFNSSLTFDNLKDLGMVEALNVNGTTYYFLAEYLTVNEAESARKKVVQRGVKDAYIMFYFNGEHIQIQEAVQLLQQSPAVQPSAAPLLISID